MAISKQRLNTIKGVKRDISRLVGDNRSKQAIQTDKSQEADVVHPTSDIDKWKDNKSRSDLKGYDDKKRFRSYAKVKRNTGGSGDDSVAERPDDYMQRYFDKYVPNRNQLKITDFASFKHAIAQGWVNDPSLKNLLTQLSDKGFAHLYNTQKIKELIKANKGVAPAKLKIGKTGLQAIKEKVDGHKWKLKTSGYIKGKSVGKVTQGYLTTGQQIYRDNKGRFASITKKQRRKTRLKKTTVIRKAKTRPQPKEKAGERKERIKKLIEKAKQGTI